MSSEFSLESVCAEFEQWRRQRRGREKIPDRLRRQAAALLETHNAFQVTKALRINHNDLKKWSSVDREPGVSASGQFAELPFRTPAESSEPLSIEFSHPSGAKLHIRGQLTEARVREIISACTSGGC